MSSWTASPADCLWNSYANQCRIALDVDRGLAFETNLLAVHYAMHSDGVALADIDMFRAGARSGPAQRAL